MVRPKRFRKIFQKPQIRCFNLIQKTNEELAQSISIEIALDEFEAIRLRDYQNVKQNKAAEIMGVSQPTFHRILNSARGKIANALIEGKIIEIKGGNYVIDKNDMYVKIVDSNGSTPKRNIKSVPTVIL